MKKSHLVWFQPCGSRQLRASLPPRALRTSSAADCGLRVARGALAPTQPRAMVRGGLGRSAAGRLAFGVHASRGSGCPLARLLTLCIRLCILVFCVHLSNYLLYFASFAFVYAVVCKCARFRCVIICVGGGFFMFAYSNARGCVRVRVSE